MYNSQASQDKFILEILKNKKNGFFLEIGSHDPIYINNTYILETKYNWKGIMIEYDNKWLKSYITERPNSYYIINDATKINYIDELEKYNAPENIDYLQIDLEVNNRSTLSTLELLDKTVFHKYKFAVVTFEHDIYNGNYYDTREISRNIFNKNGYTRVFGDVKSNNLPFEDWYLHPDLVDINFINKIKVEDSLDSNDIILHIKSFNL
jgi:hypothetical protein